MWNWWRIRSQNVTDDQNRIQISQKRRHIGRLSMLLCGILCCSLLLFVPTKEAEAYDSVSELSITVGYFGDSVIADKGSVSLSELEDACGVYQEVYTIIKGQDGGKPATVEAEGIYVTDIMDYINDEYGIDTSRVDRYNFSTQDASYAESTASWPARDLLGTRFTMREAFQEAVDEYENAEDKEEFIRNWEAYFTIENIFDFESSAYRQEAWSRREPVDAMLALRKKSSGWSGYVPGSDLTFSGLDEGGTPVLYFGQASESEQTAYRQAQMINAINLQYEGSPQFEIVDTIEGEINETGTVISVETPDEDLTEAVRRNITYESTNPDAVSVDENGNITILQEGDANINIMYNGNTIGSTGVTGKAAQEPEEPEEPEEPDKPSDKGDGSGSGDGNGDSGSGGGSGNTDGQGNNSGNNGGGQSATGNGTSGDGGSTGTDRSGLSGTESGGTSSGTGTSVSETGNAARSVVPTGGVASGQSTQQSALAAEREGAAGDTGGGDNAETVPSNQKMYEITPNQQVFSAAVNGAVDNRLLKKALLVGLIAMVIGVFAESWYYRNQTMWVKRAKRIYEKR